MARSAACWHAVEFGRSALRQKVSCVTRMISNRPDDLKRIYRARFEARAAYRQRVWSVLIERFFGRFVAQGDAVLDLGCGYGEFINNVSCAHKFAMDLNPDAKIRLRENVILFEQDCSQRWPLEEASLEVVFTSNFFEHLPNKEALGRTLDEACRCLKPGGRLIAMGPNIKYVLGAYWDFWDHHLPLTELSLEEAFVTRGLDIELKHSKFLPYTMARGGQPPVWFLKVFLMAPIAWRFFGRQFLLIGRKASAH